MKVLYFFPLVLVACAGSSASDSSVGEGALAEGPSASASDPYVDTCEGPGFARADMRPYFDETGISPTETFAKLRVNLRARACDRAAGCGGWEEAQDPLQYVQRPVDEPVLQVFLRDGVPALVLKEREHGGWVIAVCNIPFGGTSSSCTYVRDELHARPGADAPYVRAELSKDATDPDGTFRAKVTKECVRIAGSITTRTPETTTWREAELVISGAVRAP